MPRADPRRYNYSRLATSYLRDTAVRHRVPPGGSINNRDVEVVTPLPQRLGLAAVSPCGRQHELLGLGRHPLRPFDASDAIGPYVPRWLEHAAPAQEPQLAARHLWGRVIREHGRNPSLLPASARESINRATATASAKRWRTKTPLLSHYESISHEVVYFEDMIRPTVS